MSITMLIAEDHALTARYLRDNIDWRALGIRVMGVASNGREALKLMDQEQPDILLTDIRMPIMDGLELIRRVRSAGSHLRPIILSAYDEFTYAREALHLGVVDYVLKPVDDDALTETVARIAMELEQQRQSVTEEDELSETVQSHLPVLRNEYLQEVLRGNADDREVNERLQALRIEIPTQHFAVLTAELDGSTGEQETSQSRDAALNDAARALKAALSPHFPTLRVSFPTTAALIICRDKIDSRAELETIRRICRSVQKSFQADDGHTFSIGISGAHEGVSSLERCMTEATQALSQRFMGGRSGAYLYRAERHTRRTGCDYPVDSEEEILAHVSAGRPGEALDAFDRFLTKLRDSSHLCNGLIKDGVIALMLRAASVARRSSGQEARRTSEIVKEEEITALSHQQCLLDLGNECRTLLARTCEAVRETRLAAPHRVVEAATRYIELHYAERCSVADAAAFVGYSANYFSHLFKKRSGRSFSRAVAEYRVNKACRLIETGRHRISEVAEMVGFHDPQYFSQTFHRFAGVSPRDYRRSVSPKSSSLSRMDSY